MSLNKIIVKTKNEEEQRKTVIKEYNVYVENEKKGIESDYFEIKCPKELLKVKFDCLTKTEFNILFDLVESEVKDKLGLKLHGLSIRETFIEESDKTINLSNFTYHHIETEAEKNKRIKAEESKRKRTQKKLEEAVAKDKNLLKELIKKHGKEILNEV